ncbi:hypothetical protein [Paenibacillus sp. FJAT-27812]|uniref:hypothetical protein n=1 Tax=Paenibacillus sp. FJAT-27812 TaxID=1684143 RepID=UPI0006A79F8B|nr:hypothetical protein [Paenibacillus sp. FJAT-27812]
MKKVTFYAFSLILAFVFTTSAWGASTASAAAKKEYLVISENVFYYGQLKNGKPNGKGTMTWYPSKTYSGDWVDGKRTGKGKFVYRYKSDRNDFVITYDGEWKNDLKVGNGSYFTKVADHNGKVESHKVQFGTFNNDRFAAGFSVAHSVGDIPYSFNYKDSRVNLQLFGTNANMKKVWKEGKFDTIQYTKDGVTKEYKASLNQNYDPSTVKKNKAVLKSLQGMQAEINPYLDKLERLSKQVPLT